MNDGLKTLRFFGHGHRVHFQVPGVRFLGGVTPALTYESPGFSLPPYTEGN